MKIIKSPLNYIGGKYKILPQIIPLFPKKINKFVVVYGSTLKEIIDPYVGFLLNVRGRIILNENTPEIFKDAVKNLYTYNGINNIDIFKPPVIFME